MTPHMDWDRLRIFYHVAEAGSFTKAGRNLNLSQSAISRQIRALEEDLEIDLFHRHARGLIVTEQGDLLYRTVRQLFQRITMVTTTLSDSKKRPVGHLTVTATTGFSMIWLLPRIVDFMDQYPEISIGLRIEDTDLDLSMGEADVGLRLGRPTQPDLIQLRLLSINFHFFAAQHYLKEWGVPKSLKDLEKHRIIMYDDGPLKSTVNPDWLPRSFGSDRPQKYPAITINSVLGMRRAVESGLGIAILPDYVIDDTSSMIQIELEAPLPTVDVYFVYPEEQRHSARINAFRNFLVSQVAANKRVPTGTVGPAANVRRHG